MSCTELLQCNKENIRASRGRAEEDERRIVGLPFGTYSSMDYFKKFFLKILIQLLRNRVCPLLIILSTLLLTVTGKYTSPIVPPIIQFAIAQLDINCQSIIPLLNILPHFLLYLLLLLSAIHCIPQPIHSTARRRTWSRNSWRPSRT